MTKKIVAVICTWNKKEDVLTCIESLLAGSYPIEKIIVVDNASNDKTCEAIEEKDYKTVQLIKNQTNTGGSGGFNKGIKTAVNSTDGEYFWLLDNDAVASKEALKHLVEELDKDSSVGIAGSKIYMNNTNKIIQEIGSYIDFDYEIIKLNKVGIFDEENTKEVLEVDYVPACSMLIKRECIEKAGYIDTEYFVYWDDIDWCHRVKKAGYKILAVGSSLIYHKFTGNQATTINNYYFFRNNLYFFEKYSSLKKSIKTSYNGASHLWYRVIYFIVVKRYELIWPIITALLDFISGEKGKKENISKIPLMNKDGVKCSGDKVLIVVAQRYHIFKDSILNIFKNNPNTKFSFLGSKNMINILSAQGIKGDFITYPKDMFKYDKNDDELLFKIKALNYSEVLLFINYRISDNLKEFIEKIDIAEKNIVDGYCNKIKFSSLLKLKLNLLSIVFKPLIIVTYTIILFKRIINTIKGTVSLD